MSTKTRTQNASFSIENGVNDIRVWMQQKSNFALENLCLSLSNGEFVSCTAAGILLFTAMVAAHFEEYGWAVAAAITAGNVMKPVIQRFVKQERGRK